MGRAEHLEFKRTQSSHATMEHFVGRFHQLIVL